MSQNYTPVEWVDETTSQQGTLINKARLDQMQTAHHYADGFEEVDTIPTADPGVSYHKVVYCTADSTIYRWDGTEWTKDIDDDTKALLQQEIARATAAEGELAQDIEDEATAREQADTALGERITAVAGDLADHEADTDNPHQVTKAQVGLGNVDNTSDLNKPVSTAQQAALDLKADNSNVVNSINGLKGTVALYPANIPMGPGQATLQQRLDVDLDLINQNTGYIGDLHDSLDQEISDRVAAIAALQASVYSKTEADNLLASKAPVTALTDGSVTKVGTADVGSDLRPIKLVGGVPTVVTNDFATQAYVGEALDGYAPMVRTTDNQDIYGNKTIHNQVLLVAKTFTVSRTFGYHRIFKFNNSNTKQISLLIGDRYSMAAAHVTLTVDTTDPTVVTATGTVYFQDSPNRTEVGIMYDPTDEGYYFVIHRLSGGNIYTSGLIFAITEGTSSNPTYVQTEDTVLDETPAYYAGVLVI